MKTKGPSEMKRSKTEEGCEKKTVLGDKENAVLIKKW